MSKSVYCDELLNYSVKDLLSGGSLCEGIDIELIPLPQRDYISSWFYTAYPVSNDILKKYPLAGYLYLRDNPTTGKMEIIHWA